MNKIREIIESWSIAKNPTEEQKQKAEQRLEICHGCEHRMSLVEGFDICGRCG